MGEKKESVHSSGRMGEDYAAAVLADMGYEILARGYHSRFGEVDVIACKDDAICFVEVKTRKRGSMVGGFEAVTRSKQRKIIATALLYMQQHQISLQPRFDVMHVVVENGAAAAHEYLTGAFDGEAYTEHF